MPDSGKASEPSERTEVILVGAGVSFPDHLTAEALGALGQSRKIFTIVPDEYVSQLPSDLREKCVSLWHLYDPSRKRRENYKDVIETIAGNLVGGSSIAYLTPGHPLIFDSVAEGLRLRASVGGFAIRIIPGVSCIDTILADVGYEPANGLVIHEATVVVAQGLPLDADMATILLQLGVFGTEYPRLSGEDPLPDLSSLRDHICRYYPADLQVAFVLSRWGIYGKCSVAWTPLNSMLEVRKELIEGSSLFIPRADYRGLALSGNQPVSRFGDI